MIDDDNDIDCDSLLMGRLVRQELELAKYDEALKELNKMYMEVYETLTQVIECLPEPEVIREVIEYNHGNPYNDYLNKIADYFDQLKISLEYTKK